VEQKLSHVHQIRFLKRGKKGCGKKERMMSDESRAKGWSQDGFTLCHENVNLPRLHGNERLVDGIDLDEDQGLRRFARLLIVVSDELDPAAQVFPKGEPDRPHAILECQFEKGEVLGPRFLELPPEKTGADGERTRGPAERRPCDGELVPEFLDPCVGWMVVPHTSFSPSPLAVWKWPCLTWSWC
jgi:hypothetical protein